MLTACQQRSSATAPAKIQAAAWRNPVGGDVSGLISYSA